MIRGVVQPVATVTQMRWAYMSEFVAKGLLNKKEKKFKGLSEISFINS